MKFNKLVSALTLVGSAFSQTTTIIQSPDSYLLPVLTGSIQEAGDEQRILFDVTLAANKEFNGLTITDNVAHSNHYYSWISGGNSAVSLPLLNTVPIEDDTNGSGLDININAVTETGEGIAILMTGTVISSREYYVGNFSVSYNVGSDDEVRQVVPLIVSVYPSGSLTSSTASSTISSTTPTVISSTTSDVASPLATVQPSDSPLHPTLAGYISDNNIVFNVTLAGGVQFNDFSITDNVAGSNHYYQWIVGSVTGIYSANGTPFAIQDYTSSSAPIAKEDGISLSEEGVNIFFSGKILSSRAYYVGNFSVNYYLGTEQEEGQSVPLIVSVYPSGSSESSAASSTASSAASSTASSTISSTISSTTSSTIYSTTSSSISSTISSVLFSATSSSTSSILSSANIRTKSSDISSIISSFGSSFKSRALSSSASSTISSALSISISGSGSSSISSVTSTYPHTDSSSFPITFSSAVSSNFPSGVISSSFQNDFTITRFDTTEFTTTLTITSCSDNECYVTTETLVECPYSTIVVTETQAASETTITITSCDEICHESTILTGFTTVTENETIYTTYCPLSTLKSYTVIPTSIFTTLTSVVTVTKTSSGTEGETVITEIDTVTVTSCNYYTTASGTELNSSPGVTATTRISSTGTAKGDEQVPSTIQSVSTPVSSTEQNISVYEGVAAGLTNSGFLFSVLAVFISMLV